MRIVLTLSMLLALLADPAAGQAPVRQTLVLSGDITAGQRATYVETSFEAPAGARSVSVHLAYDGHDAGTTLDIGLRDPAGFRGWSGSNKADIYLAAFEATPSYRTGPILPGRWTLLIGAPAIRDGSSTHWTARIEFNGPAPAAMSAGAPGWWRGDFHTHTGHSDGSCANPAGDRVPCPVRETLEAARRAGLDFIAVTDHNTFSQNESLAELAPFYPGLTIVHGAEITTFEGHANALGVRYPVDFQLGSPRLPSVTGLIDQVNAQGGIVSLSHPGLASGEACMGCGWTATTDFSRVTAVEAVNGGQLRAGTYEGPTSGIRYWESRLNEGYRLTAIGGSDNHDALDQTGERQSPVGHPATVVWTGDASEQAVIDGVRSGRVFIDLRDRPASVLDIAAVSSDVRTPMGGEMRLGAGQDAELRITWAGVGLSSTEIVSGGLDVTRLMPEGSVQPASDQRAAKFSLARGAERGWIRVNVRAPDGTLLLIGNPIYVRRR